MTNNELIGLTGKGMEIIQLAKEGYNKNQISEFLVSQGIKLKANQIATYLKNNNIAYTDIMRNNEMKKQSKEEKIHELILDFPIINTVKMMSNLELPEIINNQSSAIEALQRCHIQTMFDVWAVYQTYLNLFKDGKIDKFPVEMSKIYVIMAELGCKILGLQPTIDDNAALKRVEQMGLTVTLTHSLDD